MHILAVGSPKGGVGKSTTAVTLAMLAARDLKLRTLVVDADENRSALDWMADSPDIDVAGLSRQDDGRLDVDQLRRLRHARGYDLAVIDLPGARVGAFEAVLTGHDGQPVADLLVVPTLPEVLDLRPVARAVRREVIPLGLPYLVVLTKVPTEAAPRAHQRQGELREGQGLDVADTLVRRYVAYDEAAERSRTVLDVGGRHHYARRAENDYRRLAIEVYGRLGVDTTALAPTDEES